MPLEQNCHDLLRKVEELRDRLRSAQITIGERDDAGQEGSAAAGDFDDRILQLLGGVEELHRVAEDGTHAAAYPTNVELVRRAIVNCQGEFNHISRDFNDIVSYDRIGKLLDLGQRRRGEWIYWANAVKAALGGCQQPLYDVEVALFVCWQDLVERTIMPGDKRSESLEHARLLFSNVLEWYKSADSKAQILLTVDGVFLSFLTGSLFLKRSDLRGVIEVFGTETWVFLGVMVMTLIGSIGAALACLSSRIGIPQNLQNHIADVRSKEGTVIRPEIMWFFGMVAQLNDPRRFQERMRAMTVEDEINALASEIFLVSKNVLNKHQWLNRGVFLITIALLLFLAAGVSYLIRV
jgi:hypothetical protein